MYLLSWLLQEMCQFFSGSFKKKTDELASLRAFLLTNMRIFFTIAETKPQHKKQQDQKQKDLFEKGTFSKPK